VAVRQACRDLRRVWRRVLSQRPECLSRRLPSGRIIRIDTAPTMLAGGHGIAHLDMCNNNNDVSNLKYVTFAEARDVLMAFVAPLRPLVLRDLLDEQAPDEAAKDELEKEVPLHKTLTFRYTCVSEVVLTVPASYSDPIRLVKYSDPSGPEVLYYDNDGVFGNVIDPSVYSSVFNEGEFDYKYPDNDVGLEEAVTGYSVTDYPGL
jgi:hypothetical protein